MASRASSQQRYCLTPLTMRSCQVGANGTGQRPGGLHGGGEKAWTVPHSPFTVAKRRCWWLAVVQRRRRRGRS